jgi:hypothetical protein
MGSTQQKIIVAEKWNVSEANNPVRNTNHDYLKFVNSAVFSEEARHFMRYGYYTDAPAGTKDYEDYWEEQDRRCIEGYSVGGVRIPGRYYFMLNFGMIKARPIDPKTGIEYSDRKIWTFPKFLDHQYYIGLELEECFAEGPHVGKPMQGMICLKSRRKGFSYFDSSTVSAYNYNFVPGSTTVLAAFETQYYKVPLDAVHTTLNHLNKYTCWSKRRIINRRDHIKSGFKGYDRNGQEIEDGDLSEFLAVSFKDNPFKSIGESIYAFNGEELGRWPDFLTAYSIAEPTFRDGNIMTGVPILWGSAADIEVGSVGLEDMFYNPSAYGLKGYENIYDDNATGKCGYFIDDLWYYPDKVVKKHFVNGKEQTITLEGVDVNGNSIREVAYDSLMEKRNLRARGDRYAYNKFISQQPLKPSEAFLRVEGNRFDVTRAQARLSIIESNRTKYINSIQCVDLEINNGNVVIVPDLIHPPLRDFPLKDNINKPGVIEIYEEPVIDRETGKPYRNRVIFGIDSYDKDYSTTNSVGSIIGLDSWTDRIVVHYKGRPEADKFYEKCRRLLMLYNGTAMYERTNIGIYTYFYNAGSIHLLADEPEILAQKGLVKPMPIGNNKKGCPMPDGVKALGLELFETWLNEKAYEQPEVKDGEEPIILARYDELRSIPLLKEIIGFNPDGNYDDISAMLPLMIYREDRKKVLQSYTQKIKTRAEDPFFNRFASKTSFHPSVAQILNKEFKVN